jgi:hypothetical protein
LLPTEKVMPDTQSTYVSSRIYVFGVTTMAALAVVIATGFVLAIFVNSMHLWSVEIFFFAKVGSLVPSGFSKMCVKLSQLCNHGEMDTWYELIPLRGPD